LSAKLSQNQDRWSKKAATYWYEVGTLAVDGWAVTLTFGTEKRELVGGLRLPPPPTPQWVA